MPDCIGRRLRILSRAALHRAPIMDEKQCYVAQRGAAVILTKNGDITPSGLAATFDIDTLYPKIGDKRRVKPSWVETLTCH